jgi:hypothetical protein
MDLTPNIDSFATGVYTVTRRASTGVGTDGRAAPASSSTFTIEASVVPLSGRELQRLPEGMRVRDAQKLYTATPLKTIGAPDVITVGGEDYEVSSVTSWVGFGGDFYEVIVLKVGN